MLTIQSSSENEVHLIADSEDATNILGQQLGAALAPGCVVALIGDLGAGKTRLVQAIAMSLDVPREQVNSPTFTLVHEYPGTLTLRHCDTYRLRDPDEFLDLGLDDLLAEDGVALIEWADRVRHLLPRDVLRIEIRIASPVAREFTISANGRTSRAVLDRFSKTEVVAPDAGK